MNKFSKVFIHKKMSLLKPSINKLLLIKIKHIYNLKTKKFQVKIK